MSRNLRPKSKLCFLKVTQPKKPKTKDDDMQLMKGEIEELKNVVRELEGRLERSQMENLKKDREFKSLENEHLTVVTDIIKTKKENDSLMVQIQELKMQQCTNECAALPLLVNEECPADITMEGLNMNVCSNSPDAQVFDQSDDIKPQERVPVSEEVFDGWDKLLKNRRAFVDMISFYCKINLKDHKAFLKECITKTFTKPFIQKVHFESGNSFNESYILSCLIETVQEKFKEKNFDNIEARKEIVHAFRRFRDAKSKIKQQK